MFSKACEYGIRAAIYIAGQSEQGKRMNQKDIAKAIGSPEAFTAKILQQLVRNNIINSAKGPNGGFDIDPERMTVVKLSDIVAAMDGDEVYRGCGLGLNECNASRPCPLHNKFVMIRGELKKMLESTNLYELAIGLKDELTWLKR